MADATIQKGKARRFTCNFTDAQGASAAVDGPANVVSLDPALIGIDQLEQITRGDGSVIGIKGRVLGLDLANEVGVHVQATENGEALTIAASVNCAEGAVTGGTLAFDGADEDI